MPHFEKIKKTVAITSIPQPEWQEDNAASFLLLVSERAYWMTGETIHVSCGRDSN